MREYDEALATPIAPVIDTTLSAGVQEPQGAAAPSEGLPPTAQVLFTEVFRIADTNPETEDAERTPADASDEAPAPMGELDNLFSRLENALADKRFFKEEHRQRATMRNIRNMYTRAELSPQEVKTFHGIISALTKNDS